MPNLKKPENNLHKMEILYRGIDWLRIGYYTATDGLNDYNTLINTLKDIIRYKEHQERFFSLPAVGHPHIENISFRVKTAANIYPYIVMLVYEPLNISIRLGKPLREEDRDLLNQGIAPIPSLMVELTSKSLRPQKLPETYSVLATFFNFLADIGTFPQAFTFSRIDYALDFPQKEEALNLLLEFENFRKIKIQTPEGTYTFKKP
ncbi:MAG: hypothetical protein GXN97_06565 [Aquificae bacterium]|nr:hypothetical protein [Aquificota bacterium]